MHVLFYVYIVTVLHNKNGFVTTSSVLLQKSDQKSVHWSLNSVSCCSVVDSNAEQSINNDEYYIIMIRSYN